MGVTVQFACDGCDAKIDGTDRVRPESVFGTHVGRLASSVTPKRWVAFDPWTNCTYCPRCWAGITKTVK